MWLTLVFTYSPKIWMMGLSWRMEYQAQMGSSPSLQENTLIMLNMIITQADITKWLKSKATEATTTRKTKTSTEEMGVTPVTQKEDQYVDISPAFRKEQQPGPAIWKGRRNPALKTEKGRVNLYQIIKGNIIFINSRLGIQTKRPGHRTLTKVPRARGGSRQLPPPPSSLRVFNEPATSVRCSSC